MSGVSWQKYLPQGIRLYPGAGKAYLAKVGNINQFQNARRIKKSGCAHYDYQGKRPRPASGLYLLAAVLRMSDERNRLHRALSTCAQGLTKGYLSAKGFWTQRQAGVKVPIQYPGMHLSYKAPHHPPPQIQGFSPRLPCDPCLLIFTWNR